MIKQDFTNCIRLLHTVEKQIFDEGMYRRAANSSKNLVENKVELEIFQLIDLFVRDSSLGLFQSRLNVIQLLYQSLVLKQEILEKKGNSSSLVQLPDYKRAHLPLIQQRLCKITNILHFTLGYYGQFKEKL